MNPERYRQLADMLVEGDLPPEDAAELAAGLRARPELQRDLGRQLALWDIWSQRVARERSAEAFVEEWKTRVAAAPDPLSAPEATGARWISFRDRASFWKRWRPAQVAFLILVLAGLAAAAWWAHERFFPTPLPAPQQVPWLPANTNKDVRFSGDGVCTACVLHITEHAKPALRITRDGTNQIVFLEYQQRPQQADAMHELFAQEAATTAYGVLRTGKVGLILRVRRLEINGQEYH